MIPGQYATYEGRRAQVHSITNWTVPGPGGLPRPASRYALMVDGETTLTFVTVPHDGTPSPVMPTR